MYAQTTDRLGGRRVDVMKGMFLWESNRNNKWEVKHIIENKTRLELTDNFESNKYTVIWCLAWCVCLLLGPCPFYSADFICSCNENTHTHNYIQTHTYTHWYIQIQIYDFYINCIQWSIFFLLTTGCNLLFYRDKKKAFIEKQTYRCTKFIKHLC